MICLLQYHHFHKNKSTCRYVNFAYPPNIPKNYGQSQGTVKSGMPGTWACLAAEINSRALSGYPTPENIDEVASVCLPHNKEPLPPCVPSTWLMATFAHVACCTSTSGTSDIAPARQPLQIKPTQLYFGDRKCAHLFKSECVYNFF